MILVNLLLKDCTKCGTKRLNGGDFQSYPVAKTRKRVLNSWCKSCVKTYKARRFASHTPEQRAEHNRKSSAHLHAKRAEAHLKLGGKCAAVDCSTPGGRVHERALTIDHVNNDGWHERANHGSDRLVLYRNVMADTQGRYQLLCANCNQIKAHEHSYKGRGFRTPLAAEQVD